MTNSKLPNDKSMTNAKDGCHAPLNRDKYLWHTHSFRHSGFGLDLSLGNFEFVIRDGRGLFYATHF